LVKGMAKKIPATNVIAIVFLCTKISRFAYKI